MLKKNILIHIGGHKTGSSAIHHCLKENYQNLFKQNFFYFDTYKDEKMHNFLNSYNDSKRTNYINNIIIKIKKLNKDNIIISRGSLCGTVDKQYNDSEIFAYHFSKLKEHFNIKIVYLIRDPLPFLISIFFQLKKNPKYLNLDIVQFVNNYQPDKFFDKTIVSYKKYFGKNLIILNYSKIFKNDYKKFLLSFFQIISSNLTISAKDLNVNYSLSKDSKLIIENSLIFLSKDYKIRASKILILLDKINQKIFRSKFMNVIFYQKDKLEFIKHFQSKNSWSKLNLEHNLNLNCHYSVEVPKRSIIFNLIFFLCTFFLFGISKKNNLFQFYKSIFILK